MQKLLPAILAGVGSLCLLFSTTVPAAAPELNESVLDPIASTTEKAAVYEAPARAFHVKRPSGDVVGVHFDAQASKLTLCRESGCVIVPLAADDVVALSATEMLAVGPGARARSCAIGDAGNALTFDCNERSLGALLGRQGTAVLSDGRRFLSKRQTLRESVSCSEGQEGTRCSSARAFVEPQHARLIAPFFGTGLQALIATNDGFSLCDLASNVCAPAQGLEALRAARRVAVSETLEGSSTPVLIGVGENSVGVCQAAGELTFTCRWKEIGAAQLEGSIVTGKGGTQRPSFKVADSSGDAAVAVAAEAARTVRLLIPWQKYITMDGEYMESYPVGHDFETPDGTFETWSDSLGVYELDWSEKVLRQQEHCGICVQNLQGDLATCEAAYWTAYVAWVGISTGVLVGSWYRGPGTLFNRITLITGSAFAAGTSTANLARDMCNSNAWSRYFSCFSARGC